MTTGANLPWYSGAQTFMKSPLVAIEGVKPGMVVIGGAPHDSTHTSRFGTRMGPRGIREGSHVFADRLRNVAGQGLMDVKTGAYSAGLDMFAGCRQAAGAARAAG